MRWKQIYQHVPSSNSLHEFSPQIIAQQLFFTQPQQATKFCYWFESLIHNEKKKEALSSEQLTRSSMLTE